MSEKLISADDVLKYTVLAGEIKNPYMEVVPAYFAREAPAVDAVELSRKELGHLINDTIAYIWRLEDRGLDNSESGYDSRKALLEKLQRFEKEHFPEMACCCGERREENAVD